MCVTRPKDYIYIFLQQLKIVILKYTSSNIGDSYPYIVLEFLGLIFLLSHYAEENFAFLG